MKLVLLGLVAVSSGAFAQTSLSLNDAIRLTLAQHPQLKKYAYQSEAVKGMVQQAGISTPMNINLDVEDVIGTGNYSGLSAMQTTLSISWLLEDEIIKSRVKVAGEQAQTSELARQGEALDLAAETAGIFITLLAQKEQLKLAKLAEAQAKKVLENITVRVKAGKSNLVDQLRAKAALSQKALVVEDLNHEIKASRARLVAQWQGDANIQINGSLQDIPSIEALNAADKKLKNHPRLKAFAARQRLAQSEISLAKATEKPAWKINTGFKRNEQLDDFAFTAGISIPFGSENRNQGKILALQAQQNEQQAQADAWYQETSTRLLLLTHKLKHNRHVIQGLGSETIPTLELASVKAGQAYRTGSYSYTDWYAVQQELLAAQTELITAYTNIHLNKIELERLTGASISH
ncbi:TolC family protein [Thalassomonas sp. RHCl1]|uniref:TolC family protein n=1 Tax=Thalassomonas sp. RHCl1 TaxID=2995320 RepID=UPI00248D3064|nr:TolC family protein [Thalassomonas sp. RHCl1]